MHAALHCSCINKYSSVRMHGSAIIVHKCTVLHAGVHACVLGYILLACEHACKFSGGVRMAHCPTAHNFDTRATA